MKENQKDEAKAIAEAFAEAQRDELQSKYEASQASLREALQVQMEIAARCDELLALVKRAQARHASQGYMSMADQQLDDDMRAAITKIFN